MVAVEPSPAAIAAAPPAAGRIDQMHEDQQVGLGGPRIQCDLARRRAADLGQMVGIFGIVIGQQAIGVEGAEDALANDVLQFLGRHPTVQTVCTDQGDIVNASTLAARAKTASITFPRISGRCIFGVGVPMSSKAIVSLIDGCSHGREWSDSIGASSAALIASARSGTRGQRLGRVDHPGSERELLKAETISVGHQQRRSAIVDLEDETGSAHLTNLLSSVAPSAA